MAENDFDRAGISELKEKYSLRRDVKKSRDI